MPESWFLKIDGIPGESTSDGHKDEIDVLSWSVGVTQTGSAGPVGGGAGRAAFQDFHFVAAISQASPMLFLACASGTHIKEASLTGARSAAKVKMSEFLKYRLSDVVVSSVQESDSVGGSPTEQFSLNYSKIEISYTPQSATGAAEPPIQVGWDVKVNKKV